MDAFKLGEDFLFGTATASVQIEGGDTNNTWYHWCQAGHISDKSSSITACDHWNRVREDTLLLKNMNVQTHRMSLEWSRIEPEPGRFSADAVEHYRNEIKLLLNYDIRPLVTLHHFSEPQWFQDAGGWLKPENSEFFIGYTKHVIKKLGDLVCEWVTFNEPNVYTYFGYEMGIFPPGTKNLIESQKVKSELIKTHVKVYKMIHDIRRDKGFKGKTMVGAAIHIRIFDGITFSGRRIASAVDYYFNELLMEGITKGSIKFPIPHNGYKNGEGTYADFLGINYYTRNIVEFAWDPRLYFHKLVNDGDLDKTDMGWDIYPEGIYQVCKKYYKKYKLPIYITENGISDRYDNRRPKFIIDHLSYIAKAIKEGIPVKRYYHWTLMDNFEWLEGQTANFGLYHCDFDTQKRTARKSASVYADICKNKEWKK